MNDKTLIGYCDRLSVCPGETVKFMVSCYKRGPSDPRGYRADIVRIICGDISPDGAGFKEEEIETSISRQYQGREQTVYPGSYAVVPSSDLVIGLKSFSLQAMIFPTTPGRGRQSVMGTWSESDKKGFALILEKDGSLGLVLGDGTSVETISTSVPMAGRRWAFVAASYDAASGQVQLTQEPLPHSAGNNASAQHASIQKKASLSPAAGGDGEFAFAAWREKDSGQKRIRGGFFNGRIDSPCLSNRILSRVEMKSLSDGRPEAFRADHLIGSWDFSLDISSEKITDLSPHGLHGQTYNLPTRAIPGFRWTGEEHNWVHRLDHYGAIHFHDDDIYDAGWEPDFEFAVPQSLKSGIYAARLVAGDCDDYIPFFVRPPRGTATAKTAFLASTANYMAYANARILFALSDMNDLNPNEKMLLAHREFGGGHYDRHSDGSGIVYSSRLRPVTNMRPKTIMWSFNADTNITAWLEQIGEGYDVITDEDLHLEGADLLRRYKVVISGTHPEYYSTQMLDGLDAYLQGGGRFMYMGGNGFYWRVAFHPEKPGVMEMRRAEDGTRAWIAEPGEYYQSFNGEYGGLWRRLGRPPNRLVGIGFAAQGFGRGAPYKRKPGSFDPRAAFIFDGIEKDEVIGDFGRLHGAAAGQEIDRYDTRLGSPPHALVLATSDEHSRSMLQTKEEFMATVIPNKDPRNVRADLVFFECPNGGAVFSVGSMTWCASLAHDNYENNVSRITTNVVRRFVQDEPFEIPESP